MNSTSQLKGNVSLQSYTPQLLRPGRNFSCSIIWVVVTNHQSWKKWWLLDTWCKKDSETNIFQILKWLEIKNYDQVAEVAEYMTAGKHCLLIVMEEDDRSEH